MFQVFQMTKGESSDELVLGEPSLHDEARTVKRRNRVLQSCIPCHELRRKCDRKRPCTRCVDHAAAGQCVYQLEDPATRSTDQDELTRLRKRVFDLEHTVQVLRQRHRDADDRSPSGSSRTLGLSEDGKKGGESGSSSANFSAQRRHGSPGSSVGTTGSAAQCGCPSSSVGRQILTQLVTNLTDAVNRLKTLPEHQQRNHSCHICSQITNLLTLIKTLMGAAPMQLAVYPSGAPQQSYGLQSPYAPTSSSHSSASPPQSMTGDFLAFNPNEPAFDLNTPAEPYPYNAPHSSTLSHSLSHSLSHPQLASATSSHGQQGISYALSGALGMGSSSNTYQQYQQPAAQPMQHYGTAVGSMPRASPSAASQGSSLATWNSMGGGSASAAQPMHRPSSKSTRNPSSRPTK